MQKYRYRAVSLRGEAMRGVFYAEDLRDLRQRLAEQNLFLLSARRAVDLRSRLPLLLLGGAARDTELTAFTRQLAILLNAGIPLPDALAALREQPFSYRFSGVVARLYERVRAGSMLSDAMQESGIFPEFLSAMVRVGERGGRLERVLVSIADYYETEAAARKNLRNVLAYPMLLLVLALGIVVLMMTVVVPAFRDALFLLDVEEKGLTRTVFAISDFLLSSFPSLLLAVLLPLLLIAVLMRTRRGKFLVDSVLLRLPVVGEVRRNRAAARFARGMGLLLLGGMNIVDALETAGELLGDRCLERRYVLAVRDIREGMPIATAFSLYRLFPDMMTQMITVGERSAALSEVLSRACRFFDERVEWLMRRLASRLQVFLLLCLGAIIAILFVAVYSPILLVMTELG